MSFVKSKTALMGHVLIGVTAIIGHLVISEIAFAEDPYVDDSINVQIEEVVAATESGETTSQIVKDTSLSRSPLQAHYSKAMQFVIANNLADAEREFNALRDLASEHGYINLGVYSNELLRLVDDSEIEVDASMASVVYQWAKKLSPRDAKTFLTAALFDRNAPIGTRVTDAILGIQEGLKNPIIVAKLSLNLLLVVLVSLTCALITASLIQIVRFSPDLLYAMQKSMPKQLRGLTSLLALIAVLTLPAIFGLLVVLAVWALFLSYYRNSCRLLGISSGIIILSWGLFIPTYLTVASNSVSKLGQTLEEVFQGNYVPGATKIVDDSLVSQGPLPILIFAKAQLHQYNKEYLVAEKLLSGLVSNVSLGQSARNAAFVNLGANQYLLGKYQEAKKSLESALHEGDGSFAVLYNLAQVSVRLTDMPKNREYLAKALAKDKSEKQFVEELGLTKLGVLFEKMPGAVLAKSLFKNDVLLLNITAQNKSAILVTALFGSMSSGMLSGFGVIVFLLGLCIYFSAKQPGIKHRFKIGCGFGNKPSRVWLCLPGGRSFVTDKPIHGTVILTVILALVIFGVQQPVRLFEILPISSRYNEMFIYLAVSVIIIGIISNWMKGLPEQKS